VVAIISVLAALTMRTLPAVRQAVDRATCVNGQPGVEDKHRNAGTNGGRQVDAD
jgi:hypothetical protein